MAILHRWKHYPGVKQLPDLLNQNEVPLLDKTLPGMKHDWRGDWLETISLLTKPNLRGQTVMELQPTGSMEIFDAIKALVERVCATRLRG